MLTNPHLKGDCMPIYTVVTAKTKKTFDNRQQADDWFYAIDDMTKEFYEKFGKMP